MIKQSTILINQLLAHVHFDSADKSIIRISFDNVIKILLENDIIVPPKMYEETLNKVLNEKLVGKVQATDTTKWAVAQAILNTAFLLAVSKDDIIKHKIKTNQA